MDVELLKRDFLDWSGGRPASAVDQREVDDYIESSAPIEWDPEEVSAELKNWASEGDVEDFSDPVGADMDVSVDEPSVCPQCGAELPACACEDDVSIHDRPTLRPEGKITDFDKYMDKILISEGRGRPPVKQEDNPQRRRAAMRQDRPLNKIRFGAK